jgi:hypothetical protein
MDAEIQPREPNEKQKVAAYDYFMDWVKSAINDSEYGEGIGWAAFVLRDYALSAPDGSKEG